MFKKENEKYEELLTKAIETGDQELYMLVMEYRDEADANQFKNYLLGYGTALTGVTIGWLGARFVNKKFSK